MHRIHTIYCVGYILIYTISYMQCLSNVDYVCNALYICIYLKILPTLRRSKPSKKFALFVKLRRHRRYKKKKMCKTANNGRRIRDHQPFRRKISHHRLGRGIDRDLRSHLLIFVYILLILCKYFIFIILYNAFSLISGELCTLFSNKQLTVRAGNSIEYLPNSISFLTGPMS